MYIVSSSYFLRNLRDLDFFTLDLGKSKKESAEGKFRKLDDFSVKYKNLYNKQILKFGQIGSKIIFYEDISMKKNEYKIFKDEDIYEIEFTQDEIKDMKNYILETLRKIDLSEEKEKEVLEKNDKLIEEYIGDDGWTAPEDDPKNAGKKYSIDQKLSREEYRKVVYDKFVKNKT